MRAHKLHRSVLDVMPLIKYPLGLLTAVEWSFACRHVSGFL